MRKTKGTKTKIRLEQDNLVLKAKKHGEKVYVTVKA